MTHFVGLLSPLDKVDREHDLMTRLIEDQAETDVLPQQWLTALLGALNEIVIAVNSCGDSIAPHFSLRTVLVAGANLARQFGVSLYEADEWPDGNHTRIGGDGALASGHDPRRLVAELCEAAAWVVDFVDSNTVNASAVREERRWLDAEPITELIARTWCLADRLAARESLRRLIENHLSSQLTGRTQVSIDQIARIDLGGPHA